MRGLVDSIAAGAGRCSAEALNGALNAPSAQQSGANGNLGTVGNVMPTYCTAYLTHPYTDLQAASPVYIGTPERGGLWVEPAASAQAQAAYTARVTAEDADKSGHRSGRTEAGF